MPAREWQRSLPRVIASVCSGNAAVATLLRVRVRVAGLSQTAPVGTDGCCVHVCTCSSADVRHNGRFLGWVKSSREATGGALDCSIFGTDGAQDLVEQFCRWCQADRGLSFGTIGSYLNSLISAVNYAHSCRICDVPDELLQAMYNLRLQSEAQGREDKKWCGVSDDFF